MVQAVIFDLDETLVDSSALADAREARRWGEVGNRIGEVVRYEPTRSSIAVADLPARVKSEGMGVGILTASPEWYAKALLKRFGVKYDAIITGSDSYPPKPDPASLAALIDELGSTPEATIMVGDSTNDFGAAMRAGVPCIGVVWDRGRRPDWRREWPDVVAATPERVLESIAGMTAMGPVGEAVLAGVAPSWHFGSTIPLGNRTFGLGRYFSATDLRHGTSGLSRLILDAKDDADEAANAAEVFRTWGEWRARVPPPFDIVTSIPPKPSATIDRFGAARAELVGVFGVVDRPDIITCTEEVDDYKTLGHAARALRNASRFNSVALNDERVLLVEDVLTTEVGGQASTCAQRMVEAGARSVTVVGLGVTQEPNQREQCPECGGLLRVRNGRYGLFLGCSNYSNTRNQCWYTRDL